MIITQQIMNDKWLITIDFQNAVLTNSHFPIYISGNFNNWKTEFNYITDEDYRVETPPNGGANNLLPCTISVPCDWEAIEFKLVDSYGFMNFEDYNDLFSGELQFSPNDFGTANIIVFNDFL